MSSNPVISHSAGSSPQPQPQHAPIPRFRDVAEHADSVAIDGFRVGDFSRSDQRRAHFRASNPNNDEIESDNDDHVENEEEIEQPDGALGRDDVEIRLRKRGSVDRREELNNSGFGQRFGHLMLPNGQRCRIRYYKDGQQHALNSSDWKKIETMISTTCTHFRSSGDLPEKFSFCRIDLNREEITHFSRDSENLETFTIPEETGIIEEFRTTLDQLPAHPIASDDYRKRNEEELQNAQKAKKAASVLFGAVDENEDIENHDIEEAFEQYFKNHLRAPEVEFCDEEEIENEFLERFENLEETPKIVFIRPQTPGEPYSAAVYDPNKGKTLYYLNPVVDETDEDSIVDKLERQRADDNLFEEVFGIYWNENDKKKADELDPNLMPAVLIGAIDRLLTPAPEEFQDEEILTFEVPNERDRLEIAQSIYPGFQSKHAQKEAEKPGFLKRIKNRFTGDRPAENE